MTLISSAQMDEHPGNTIAEFTTTMNNEDALQLPKGSVWKVRMTELHYPGLVTTFGEEDVEVPESSMPPETVIEENKTLEFTLQAFTKKITGARMALPPVRVTVTTSAGDVSEDRNQLRDSLQTALETHYVYQNKQYKTVDDRLVVTTTELRTGTSPNKQSVAYTEDDIAYCFCAEGLIRNINLFQEALHWEFNKYTNKFACENTSNSRVFCRTQGRSKDYYKNWMGVGDDDVFIMNPRSHKIFSSTGSMARPPPPLQSNETYFVEGEQEVMDVTLNYYRRHPHNAFHSAHSRTSAHYRQIYESENILQNIDTLTGHERVASTHKLVYAKDLAYISDDNGVIKMYLSGHQMKPNEDEKRQRGFTLYKKDSQKNRVVDYINYSYTEVVDPNTVPPYWSFEDKRAVFQHAEIVKVEMVVTTHVKTDLPYVHFGLQPVFSQNKKYAVYVKIFRCEASTEDQPLKNTHFEVIDRCSDVLKWLNTVRLSDILEVELPSDSANSMMDSCVKISVRDNAAPERIAALTSIHVTEMSQSTEKVLLPFGKPDKEGQYLYVSTGKVYSTEDRHAKGFLSEDYNKRLNDTVFDPSDTQKHSFYIFQNESAEMRYDLANDTRRLLLREGAFTLHYGFTMHNRAFFRVHTQYLEMDTPVVLKDGEDFAVLLNRAIRQTKDPFGLTATLQFEYNIHSNTMWVIFHPSWDSYIDTVVGEFSPDLCNALGIQTDQKGFTLHFSTHCVQAEDDPNPETWLTQTDSHMFKLCQQLYTFNKSRPSIYTKSMPLDLERQRRKRRGGTDKFALPFPVLVNGGVDNVYVHCDIVENSFVGHRHTDILGVYKLKRVKDAANLMQSVQPVHPPLKNVRQGLHDLKRVTVRLLDWKGDAVRFRSGSGHTRVELEFLNYGMSYTA